MTDEEYIGLVNSGMTTFLDDQIKLAPTLEAKELIRRIKQTTSYGKRFRPTLLFNIFRAYGGKEDIVGIGIALELFHEALLVHDDIMDEDTIRHNRPNIIGLYLNESKDKTHAYNQALLAGDLLYNFATKLVAENADIVKLFSDAFISAIYGQQLDTLNIDNKLSGITLSKLISIYELKTARYSTILPIKVAASLTNIKKPELDNLSKFGKYLGIYYQLNNDHLDYFSGDNLRDYPIGKITYPYMAGLKLASRSDLKYLRDNFGNKRADSNKVVAILTKSKAKEASLAIVSKYLDKSLAYLNELNISEQEKLNLGTRIKV